VGDAAANHELCHTTLKAPSTYQRVGVGGVNADTTSTATAARSEAAASNSEDEEHDYANKVAIEAHEAREGMQGKAQGAHGSKTKATQGRSAAGDRSTGAGTVHPTRRKGAGAAGGSAGAGDDDDDEGGPDYENQVVVDAAAAQHEQRLLSEKIQREVSAENASKGKNNCDSRLDDSVRCSGLNNFSHSRNAIEFHAFAPFEANMRVTNGTPLRWSLSYRLTLQIVSHDFAHEECYQACLGEDLPPIGSPRLCSA
jgi:hypothetical protein